MFVNEIECFSTSFMKFIKVGFFINIRKKNFFKKLKVVKFKYTKFCFYLNFILFINWIIRISVVIGKMY